MFLLEIVRSLRAHCNELLIGGDDHGRRGKSRPGVATTHIGLRRHGRVLSRSGRFGLETTLNFGHHEPYARRWTFEMV